MTCADCGFAADESEFETTDTPGDRICPQCGSLECYEDSSTEEEE